MNKLEYVARSLSKGVNKPLETYVINAIYQKVNNPELEIEVQKNIITLNNEQKRIDLYLPQLHIAIEVDEPYHNTENQKQSDKNREKNIQETVLRESPQNRIIFKRIKAHSVTLEELNLQIDNLVEEIKTAISKKKNFKWYSEEEKIEIIKQNGQITTNDTFSTNYQIINLVYNKSLKSWQRAGYNKIWFPVLSYLDKNYNLTATDSWVNYFDSSRDIIFEKSTNKTKQEKKIIEAEKDKQNKIERFVFVKEKDTFGKPIKRFAGIFVADGRDEDQQAERWRKKSTILEIPISE